MPPLDEKAFIAAKRAFLTADRLDRSDDAKVATVIEVYLATAHLITVEHFAKLVTAIDFARDCATVPVSNKDERDNKGKLLMQLLKDARELNAARPTSDGGGNG